MTSVERVLAYGKLESEAHNETVELKQQVKTSDNAVEFQNVSLRYSTEDKCILKDVSFAIRRGEKVLE